MQRERRRPRNDEATGCGSTARRAPDDFPPRIYAADMASAAARQTELTFTEDASKVAGLPMRAYVPVSEIDWEGLARTWIHPLRVSILEVLTLDGGRVLSPNEMTFELQATLATTSYHVRELFKAGILELVTTKQRRGAAEHYYRLAPKEGWRLV